MPKPESVQGSAGNRRTALTSRLSRIWTVAATAPVSLRAATTTSGAFAPSVEVIVATTDPSSSAACRAPVRYEPGDPPFFRGEKGEWAGDICDRITFDDQGREDSACDEAAAYVIEWKQTSRDGGTLPVSGSCEKHARDVDRNQVVRMQTHPRLAVPA